MEVLLVDDHELVTLGVAGLLAEIKQITSIACVRSLAEARQRIGKAEAGMPALVILDIHLGEENGLDFISFLKEFCRSARAKMPAVLVCSIVEDPFLIKNALEMGATGYVPKSSGSGELLRAVKAALLGNAYVPEEYGARMVEIVDTYDQLTKREKQALALLRRGNSNTQIAGAMGISRRTVENMISSIYLKTGTSNRAALMEL